MSSAYEEAPSVGETTPVGAPREQVIEVSIEKSTPPSLAMLGVLTVLVSAWVGIVPFVGPTFGYSADGSGSFIWNLAHALLYFAPGVLGIVAGLSIIMGAPSAGAGLNRFGLASSGMLALIAGAWIVIGPYAWPVLYNRFFVGSSPLMSLAHQVGYALGPGLLLALFGGIAIGWAVREDRAEVAVVHRRIRHGGLHQMSRIDQAI